MENLVAPVNRALITPSLILGVPFGAFLIIGTLIYVLTIYVHQWILGPVTGAILFLLSQAATKKDPFFVDKLRVLIRFSSELK